MAEPDLALYGHPFSSYTWKAQIALHASGLDYDFRWVDQDHPDNAAYVQNNGGPLGKFPVLLDGETTIFESTSIIEYLALKYPSDPPLLPPETDAAVAMRMLDRVFDNYVMEPMNQVVVEHIRGGEHPDQARCDEAKAKLRRSYAWLEGWLQWYPVRDAITLIECAAAPSLFYADWVEPIGDECPMLREWRAHLLAQPEVAECVEAARPFREWFPPGAPDRD